MSVLDCGRKKYATQDGVTERVTVATKREKSERHIEQNRVIVSELKDKEKLTIEELSILNSELSILNSATYYLKDGLLHLKQ